MGRGLGLRLACSVIVLMSACSAGQSDGELRSATAELSTLVGEYQGMSQPANTSSSDAWDDFYDEGADRLAAVEEKFSEWRLLLADGNSAFEEDLARFRDALAVWLSDQQAQLAASRDCFEESDRFRDRAEAAACLTGLTRGARAEEWLANSRDLSTLIDELRGKGVFDVGGSE